MEGRVTLDVIDVVEPCSEDWDRMRGDARVRFCGLCHRNVFNLSAMTRSDAEALVSEHEGRLCVRFYRRADGTVTTSDCAPDRLAALRRGAKRSLAMAAAAAAGLFTVVGALGAATALGIFAEQIVEPEPVPLMGTAPIDEAYPEVDRALDAPPHAQAPNDADEAPDQILVDDGASESRR